MGNVWFWLWGHRTKQSRPSLQELQACQGSGYLGRTDKKQTDKQVNKPESNHEKNFRQTQIEGPSAKYLTGFSKLSRSSKTEKSLRNCHRQRGLRRQEDYK